MYQYFIYVIASLSGFIFIIYLVERKRKNRAIKSLTIENQRKADKIAKIQEKEQAKIWAYINRAFPSLDSQAKQKLYNDLLDDNNNNINI